MKPPDNTEFDASASIVLKRKVSLYLDTKADILILLFKFKKLEFKMNKITLFFFLALIIASSCTNKKNKTEKKEESDIHEKIEIDTAKDYHREIFKFKANNDTREVEVYIGMGDTIPNQVKYYRNGVLDTAKSTFYKLRFNRSKSTDLILKGTISLNFPKAGKNQKFTGEEIIFNYIQRENDSTYFKKIVSDKSKINFDYKRFKDNRLIGCLWILRTFKNIPDNDSLMFSKQIVLVDNKIFTDNPFTGLK